MRYLKTIIFTVVRNGFEVLNSKQTVTMADYTFNYTVFSLSTAGRLTSVWIVLETWALRDGFRCLLLAASEEPFSFCLLPRAQGQACLGALVTCKDRQHLQLRSEASVRSQPHQPGSSPWSCPGTAIPTVADWPSFLTWRLVLFHKLLPTQKTGAAGGHGLGVLERWRLSDDVLMQRNGNRDRRGWEGRSPCLLHSHSAAQHGCCVDTAVRIFFNHLLKVIFCPYPLTIPFTISSRVMMGNSVQRNKTLKYY